MQVKALACELPHRKGLPLSGFSIADIRQEVLAQGLVAEISGATSGAGSAKTPFDLGVIEAGFPARSIVLEKAASILDLYRSLHGEGQPLSLQDFVLCADEKPSIQARRIARTEYRFVIKPGPGPFLV